MADALLHAAPQLRTRRNKDARILESDGHLQGHEHLQQAGTAASSKVASLSCALRLARVTGAVQGCMLPFTPRTDA